MIAYSFYRKGNGVEKNEEEANRLLQLSKEYGASINNDYFNKFLSDLYDEYE